MSIAAKKKSNTKIVKKSAKKDEAIVSASKKVASKSIFKSASIKKIDNFFNSVSKK
jgi:hypothetical protein